MPFKVLGLGDALVRAVTEQGYASPSPIQEKAIPAILTARDVMAIAQTGTGKTASFSLPLLQLLSKAKPLEEKCIRALIITPTRELAAQVASSIAKYGAYTNISSAVVFGGVRIEPQIFQLQTGVDILVATPGRLIDLYNQQALSFDQLEILVLDEADRMLDLGFIDDINHIQGLLPSRRQTLMFSATFSKAIKSLARTMQNNAIVIELANAKSHIEAIAQTLHPVDKSQKPKMLLHLLQEHNWQQVLVFTKTKRDADSLRDQLEEAGISAESIHANRTQRARTLALDGFKNGHIKVLVATDIAARGIDVHELACVINYDLPYVPEDYVHRIGRTGRASMSGVAVSFFSEDEAKQLNAIERVIGRQFKRTIVPGFAPQATIKKAIASEDEDEYGNFEAHSTHAYAPSKNTNNKRKRKRRR